MPECSLCGCPLAPEGGAVLFTDYQGIPFEVCEKCTGQIDLLHGSSADEQKARALDYISGCAESIENRGVYGELMRFVEGEVPGFKGNSESVEEPEESLETEPAETMQFEQAAEAEPSDMPQEPAGGKGKRRGVFWAVLGAALIFFLVIAYVLGGIHF